MPEAQMTRPVHIVTDSTSDIPSEVLQGLPVTVVPLKVEIKGKAYRDLIDLTREEFLEHLRSGEMPKTSQPSVGEFQTVYSDLVNRGFDVVSIHLSSKLSGTFNAASTAARNVSMDRISLIDSGSVSIGTGMLVLEAADLIRNGNAGDEIVARVARRAKDIWVVAAFETLENLRRGGRIGPTAAFLGSALQIKPIIQILDGEILPLERVRTSRRVLERLLALATEQAPFDRLAVMHLGAPDGAARVAEQLRTIQADLDVMIGQMGTVVGTYGGPGIIGLAGLVMSREPST